MASISERATDNETHRPSLPSFDGARRQREGTGIEVAGQPVIACSVLQRRNVEHLYECTAPGFLDTSLGYAAWRSSYSSRASSGVR